MIESERDEDLDPPELLDELDVSPERAFEDLDLNDCGDWEFVP